MKINSFITIGCKQIFLNNFSEDIIYKITILDFILSKRMKQFSNKCWSNETKELVLNNSKIRLKQDLEERLPIKGYKNKIKDIKI